MSFNFAVSDLGHHGSQTKEYIKSTVIAISLNIFFINLIYSFTTVFEPTTISTLSYSFFEIIQQYGLFLVFLTSILMVIFVLNANQVIIQHRKRDMGVMKAVGAMPKKIYSFYITEILILVLITYIIGWILGFSIYIVAMIVLESVFEIVQLRPVFMLPLFLGLILLFITFIVQGWYIRKIGMSAYGTTKNGRFGNIVETRFSESFGRFMRKKSLHLQLAAKNLMRKKREVREQLLTLSFGSFIIFTGLLGVLTLNTTFASYVEKGEGVNILCIGASSVSSSMQHGYEKFHDPDSQNPISAEGYNISSLLRAENNLTAFSNNLSSMLPTYLSDNLVWESRLLYFAEVKEEMSIKILEDELDEFGNNRYLTIGQGNRTEYAFIQGITTVTKPFGASSVMQTWNHEGNLYMQENMAWIGDTLSASIFEDALQQSLTFSDNHIVGENENITTNIISPSKYKIETLLIDPFNNGRSVYLPLKEFQHNLNLTDYTNLIMLDYTYALNELDGGVQELITLLKGYLEVNATNIDVVDLTPIFAENVAAFTPYLSFLLIFSAIIIIFIMYSIAHYQLTKLEEDKRDLSILKVIGFSKKDLHKSIFYENIFLMLVGTLIGLTGCMIIIMSVLIDGAILPSVALPFLMFLGVFGILAGLSFFSSKKIVSRGYISEFQAIDTL